MQPLLVKHNGLLLSLFVFRELSDTDNKIEVNCFDSSVLFYEDRTITNFPDNTLELMVAVRPQPR